jgi:hypothetical protein
MPNATKPERLAYRGELTNETIQLSPEFGAPITLPVVRVTPIRHEHETFEQRECRFHDGLTELNGEIFYAHDGDWLYGPDDRPVLVLSKQCQSLDAGDTGNGIF